MPVGRVSSTPLARDVPYLEEIIFTSGIASGHSHIWSFGLATIAQRLFFLITIVAVK